VSDRGGELPHRRQPRCVCKFRLHCTQRLPIMVNSGLRPEIASMTRRIYQAAPSL
jgi:hypothetical protein